ncbi:hypothetical protein I4F81_002265 [Pyropia yezoensis]|uniref:Uncharacterized protein n=1 Tax=Pyropia yezoensis TaxID=2788 RepID=A0ACC3BQL7_PYRYE|nr:hypothetical protein I4F81_002265 [Neopyropia yezoensis]
MTSAAPTDVMQLAGEVAALLGPNVTAVRLLNANATALAAEVAALRANVTTLSGAVEALQHEAGRSILGTDAYNSTAFIVALFVAAYQFIPDPTGDQDANDVSELEVYTQWRWAALTLLGYGGLMAAVVVQQLLADWGGLDLIWLLALMLAPWAPVADKVFRTLKASRRVMAMMRSRGCRNRLTAIMREYLAVGILELRPTAVFRWSMTGLLVVPGWVVPDGVENKELVLERIRLQAKWGSFMTVDDHSTFGERVKAHIVDAINRAKRLNVWDPLLRILSRRSNVMRRKGWAARWNRCRRFLCSSDSASDEETEMLSPFVYPPSGGTGGAGRADAEEQMDEMTVLGRQPMQLKPSEETVLLDAMDGVLPGGTLSKKRVKELKDRAVCDRCVMASRAAVELFVESSTCGHDGVNVAEWFQDEFTIALYGSWLITVREAATVDCKATPVRGELPNAAILALPFDSTEAVLTIFFIVARSLLGESRDLEPWRTYITDRYHKAAWWDSYWGALRDRLSQTFAASTAPVWTDARAVARSMRLAVRDTAAAQVRELLGLLLDAAPEGQSDGDLGACSHYGRRGLPAAAVGFWAAVGVVLLFCVFGVRSAVRPPAAPLTGGTRRGPVGVVSALPAARGRRGRERREW